MGYPPQIIAQPLFTISRHCTMCQPAINFEFVEESKKGQIDFWSSGYGCSQCCFFVIDEWNFFIIDEGKNGIIRFVAFSKDDEIVFIPLIATAFASTVVSFIAINVINLAKIHFQSSLFLSIFFAADRFQDSFGEASAWTRFRRLW